MSTFLFDSIIFGPVKSRRLGISLGVNLPPTSTKICSFDCIYCECGWTASMNVAEFPPRAEVRRALEAKLTQMQADNEAPDVITFAGNGEPTLHPEFAQIIDDTIECRNTFFPKARVAVLSNATMIFKPDVRSALMRVDQNILKLDSAVDSTMRLINRPLMRFDVETVIQNLKLFEGKLIVQTLFVRGEINGQKFDNTTEPEIAAWLAALIKINPQEVMIYAIARDTPAQNLQKISVDELNSIAKLVENLGIKVKVSG